MQAICAKCGMAAQIEAIAGGLRYSVPRGPLRECPVIGEQLQLHGSASLDTDCDNLLDAISIEYRRLLLRPKSSPPNSADLPVFSQPVT